MKRFLTLLLGLVVAVGLVACDSNDDDDDPATAQVRVMHASADAGAVDVFVDDQEIQTGVEFGVTLPDPTTGQNVSTSPTVSGYFDVPVGVDAAIEVRDPSSGDAILTVNADQADLEADERYTVIVAGTVSPPSGTSSPQTILLEDAFEASGSNQLFLRLVHGSALAGQVDVVLDGTPVVQNFTFGSASGSFPGQFIAIEVTGQTQTVEIQASSDGTTLLELPVGGDQGVPVEAGQFLTGVAIDVPGSNPPAGALIHVDPPSIVDGSSN